MCLVCIYGEVLMSITNYEKSLEDKNYKFKNTDKHSTHVWYFWVGLTYEVAAFSCCDKVGIGNGNIPT